MTFHKQIRSRISITKILTPAALTAMGTVIGGLFVAVVWPDTALADDCLRDPFNAEDCLRTSGWAPVIAGSVVSLIAVLASLGEIRNTLSSLSSISGVAAGAIPAANTVSGTDQYAQASASPPFYQDITDKIFGAQQSIHDAAPESMPSPEEDIEENKRKIDIAKKADLPVRIVLGVGGAAAALAGAPLIGIGLVIITVIIPDPVSGVTKFMLGNKD